MLSVWKLYKYTGILQRMQYYFGCSGWSYSSWQGPFYPKSMENARWLRYYSNVFDYVEIDSSFYRIPNKYMAKNWYNRTPKNFRFTAKFPKIITHDKRLINFDEDQLEYFFDSMSELNEKLLALLIQLPPSMQIVEGLDALRNIIPYLDKSFRYAVEVRHRSWFQDLAYNFLSNNNMCLVWSQLADLHTPPIVRIKEMKKVARNFKAGIDKGNLAPVKFAIVAANNHYAGFGPGTVNIFRQLSDLEEVKWGDEYVMMTVDNPTEKENDDDDHNANLIKTKQTNLSDFL